MSKWKGTPVPNSGLVEKVYINTALSVDEVETLISKITFTEYGTYIVCVNNDFSKVVMINKNIDENGNDILINNSYSIYSTSNGWDTSKPNFIELNGDVVSEMEGMVLGADNSLLSSLFSIIPFELVEDEPVEEDPIDDVLKPFLKEVADAIRYVEGSSEDINAQDFNERIIALGKGGGSATITKPGEGWVGTTVPNEGTVEKVYLNTNLSVEEVVGLLEGIEKQSIMGNTGCVVLTTNNHLLCALYNEGVWAIGDLSTGAFYFASADVGSGFTGWDSNFNGVIEINEEVGNIVGGEEVVFQNDKLSSLISTTPFVQSEGEQITLEGDYDGSTLVLDELPKGGWQGAAVPNEGFIEKVYFNTNLSVEEVINEIQKIPSEKLSTVYCVFCAINTTTPEMIGIIQQDGVYGIISLAYNTSYFISQDVGMGFVGWNPEFNGVFTINSELISTNEGDEGTIYGDENNLLSSLISTTPFIQTKPNTIDIKSMIENENKIPLYIKVNVSTNARILMTGTGEIKPTLPVEGYGQSVYFNNKLTEDEVNAVLSAIEFEGSSNEYVVCYFEEGSSTYKLSVTRYWYNDKPVHSIVYGSSDIFTSYTGGSGSSGWSSWMSNPIKGNLIQPGSQNDKIVNVFSGTPFSYEVPGDGSLVDIYVNTALSVEEVDAILDTIEMGGSNDSYTAYYIEYGSDGLRLCVRKGYPGWIIDNEIMGERLYDSTGGSGASFHGWNPDFDGVIEILKFKESDPGMVYGVSIYDNQNDKLANLFSIAPFEAEPIVVNLSGDYDGSSMEITENGSVDIKELIENDLKIPLSIDVNVDVAANIIDGDTIVEVKGEYDGSEIEVTENGYLNVGQLIDKGQLPLHIYVDVAANIIDGDNTVKVKGDYDGSGMEITENGFWNIQRLIQKDRKLPLSIDVDVATDVTALYKGTPVPGDGSVANIYVNKINGAHGLIENFEFLDSEFHKEGNTNNNTYTYTVYDFELDGVEYSLYIKYWTHYKRSEIDLRHPNFNNGNLTRIYYSNNFPDPLWDPDFSGFIDIEGLAGELIVNALTNDRNSQLSRLFSSTPIEDDVHLKLKGEYDGSEIEVTTADYSEFTIDLKPYIELGKLPLTIKVKK